MCSMTIQRGCIMAAVEKSITVAVERGEINYREDDEVTEGHPRCTCGGRENGVNGRIRVVDCETEENSLEHTS